MRQICWIYFKRLCEGSRTLILGGARSGKSRYALELGEGLSADRVFVATGVGFDEGMRELGREIRDLHGRMNQRVAGVCDRVLLIVAGLPVGVKSEL